MSSKRRVESEVELMHDAEEEAASGGVGKLVDSDESETCDRTRVLFLRLVPCRGGAIGTGPGDGAGERFSTDIISALSRLTIWSDTSCDNLA